MITARPTLHVTNFSSRKLHGPGRRYTIMARPRPSFGETGDGAVLIFVPHGPALELMMALVEARSLGVALPRATARYRQLLARAWALALDYGDLRPVCLMATLNGPEGRPDGRRVLVEDGDSLLCACSKEDAAAGKCHRAWLAPYAARAGWTVRLDGIEVEA